MKNSLILGALLVVVLVGGFFWSQQNTAPTSLIPQATSTPTTPPPGTYTAAQIAQHDTVSSCWSIINGGVYDLTNWINQHPGGEGPILSICGKDGSVAFNAQHGSQGQPNAILATFKIGTVAP